MKITDYGIKKLKSRGGNVYLVFGKINNKDVSALTSDLILIEHWNNEEDEDAHNEALNKLFGLLKSNYYSRYDE